MVQISPHDLGAAIYGHGPFELYNRLNWSNLVAHQEEGRGPVRQAWNAVRPGKRLEPALARLPLQATGEAISGTAPWYRECLAHPDLADPYWADQTMQQYQACGGAGLTPGPAIGPWTHVNVDVGIATRETLAWLDAFVAGDGPSPRRQPVRAWTSGTGQWRELPQWPPAQAIAGPGTCRTAARLPASHRRPGAAAGTEPEAGQEAPEFRYDPRDPTPSVGGRITSFAGGSRDNAAVEARSDVLTFSTAPLAGPVQVAGVPVVELFLRCDGECADIFARLCDVDVRGRSRNLTDQITRLGRDERGRERFAA